MDESEKMNRLTVPSSSLLTPLLPLPTTNGSNDTTGAIATTNTLPHMRRKFSFPVALHSHTSLLTDTLTTSAARRRLSNVSDVVSRKLSSTIGWKTAPIPTQDIITQGKCLCGQYIRCRLRRSGIFSKKLGLQRIRSIVGTPAVHVVREVFPALNFLGEELERMHPKLYTSVTRQISRIPGGELQAPETAPALLSAVSRDLFRTDITWGKIVSLFAIAGGLAVDCVRQGHIEYLPKLVEGISDVIEDELVVWINENGGWVGLSTYVRPESKQNPLIERMVIGIIGSIGLFMLYFVLKLLSCYLCPLLLFEWN